MEKEKEKISNSLTLRLGPERKYAPIEVEIENIPKEIEIKREIEKKNIYNLNIYFRELIDEEMSEHGSELDFKEEDYIPSEKKEENLKRKEELKKKMEENIKEEMKKKRKRQKELEEKDENRIKQLEKKRKEEAEERIKKQEEKQKRIEKAIEKSIFYYNDIMSLCKL